MIRNDQDVYRWCMDTVHDSPEDVFEGVLTDSISSQLVEATPVTEAMLSHSIPRLETFTIAFWT